MTDLGDKSQVISRITEADLTKKDLSPDDWPERYDSGAPLEFSSSLSSIQDCLSPDQEKHLGHVANVGPQPDETGGNSPNARLFGLTREAVGFAQFNKKCEKPETEQSSGSARTFPSLEPGVKGGVDEGAASGKTPDPGLTAPGLLFDIAENLFINENAQPQKFMRQDDEKNRVPTAAANEDETDGRHHDRPPAGGEDPCAFQSRGPPNGGRRALCLPNPRADKRRSSM